MERDIGGDIALDSVLDDPQVTGGLVAPVSDAEIEDVDSLFGNTCVVMDLDNTDSDQGQSDREDSLYGSAEIELPAVNNPKVGDAAEEEDGHHSAHPIHVSSSFVKQQIRPVFRSVLNHPSFIAYQKQTKQLDPRLFEILAKLLSVAAGRSSLSMPEMEYVELWIARQKKLTELTGRFRAAGSETYQAQTEEDQHEGTEKYPKDETRGHQVGEQKETQVEEQEGKEKEEQEKEQKKEHQERPVSMAQEFEYFLASFGPSSNCYNMPLLHHRGQLRLAALLYDTGDREAMFVAEDLLNDYHTSDPIEQPSWLIRKAKALRRDITHAADIMDNRSPESTPRNHDVLPMSLAAELDNEYDTMTRSSRRGLPDSKRPVNESAPRSPAAVLEKEDHGG
jgi:hypothetical protein